MNNKSKHKYYNINKLLSLINDKKQGEVYFVFAGRCNGKLSYLKQRIETKAMVQENEH